MIPFEDRGVAIPADKAGKAGIAKDQVKVSEKYGGGYPANVEGLHHLHCLVCAYFRNQSAAWIRG